MLGILVTAVLVLAGAAPGQTAVANPEDGRRARAALDRWLASIPDAKAGQVTAIDEGCVQRALPSRTFFVLRFRRYPVAPPIPESLSAGNVLAVGPDGSVKRIPDVGALEAVFRSALAPVKNREQAEDAVKAWIRLTQEFHQDGFFHFTDPEIAAFTSGADGVRVASRSLVLPDAGDSGEVRVTLTFDPAGRLAKVEEAARVVAGHRPI